MDNNPPANEDPMSTPVPATETTTQSQPTVVAPSNQVSQTPETPQAQAPETPSQDATTEPAVAPEQPAPQPAAGGPTVLYVERQFLKLVGATVRTFDANRVLLCKAEQKAFKLKEDIPFFSDENKTQEIFRIKARSIIDIAATYDITDPAGNRIGSLRRKGLSSTFVRDEWLILNATEQEIGLIQEDSNILGLLRRYVDFVALFVPQKFSVTMGGQVVGNMEQNKNPFTVKLTCTLQPGATQQLGSILTYAIPSMLAIIEARQN